MNTHGPVVQFQHGPVAIKAVDEGATQVPPAQIQTKNNLVANVGVTVSFPPQAMVPKYGEHSPAPVLQLSTIPSHEHPSLP